MATLAERATDKQTTKAIEMALTQLRATRARVKDNKVIAPQKVSGGARRKVQR